MAAAGHQVGKTDLDDLAEIRMLDPSADRNNAIDVELEPAYVRNRDIGLVEVCSGSRRAVADEPGTVCEP